ncbi:hypothetical protein RHGRI_026367 [Rhododendron griersonianum]|uniref:Small ribosomal subunit protein eS4 C-terminal domain-containing protein n=1 Tax=Rhododendron griersonianum TaxID=479676 RepID=A0AAV6ISN2_9ERIC|nr:hypothetical protein RHGRI_026367 [Rhododendron griersonianum]
MIFSIGCYVLQLLLDVRAWNVLLLGSCLGFIRCCLWSADNLFTMLPLFGLDFYPGCTIRRVLINFVDSREKHKGSFETIHVQDATGHEFATRMGNIFTIGKGSKPWVSLPKGKGIKLSIIEEAKKRHAAQVGAAA